MERVIDTLGMDEMEIMVERAFDLCNGGSSVRIRDLETRVDFDVGWPSDDSVSGGTVAEGKGQTGIVKGVVDPGGYIIFCALIY